jgi:hypothetical protein
LCARRRSRDAQGNPTRGPGYDEAILTLSKVLLLQPQEVEKSIAYMPADCALNVADVRNQVAFWREEWLIDSSVNADNLLDTSFLDEAH